MKRAAVAALLMLLAGPAAAFDWRDWTWAPPPAVPADNPMSDAKVALGRRLFYDRRLSADGSLSCAGCHRQAQAFADARPLSPGIEGEPVPRNAASLANVAYLPRLAWDAPGIEGLEAQALVPLTRRHPAELGMGGREAELRDRLSADGEYPALFRAAFPETAGRIDLGSVTRALAAFERVLISTDSPYDRWRYRGEAEALDEAARRGEALFFSDRLKCYRCHGGLHLTDNFRGAGTRFDRVAHHDTGLDGRFRTPSLRNVALTAPYMHDGRFADLESVLAHYAGGGGPGTGKSPLLAGFSLSAGERDDVIAFLRSLTDTRFVTDPRLGDPFR